MTIHNLYLLKCKKYSETHTYILICTKQNMLTHEETTISGECTCNKNTIYSIVTIFSTSCSSHQYSLHNNTPHSCNSLNVNLSDKIGTVYSVYNNEHFQPTD